ncbi:hypothetical protein TSUD_281270 [Trifolium subterraneum]|uniref:Reverse transcriptase domain-containing protein n=1 Tax=Trifolium subterraneum TaxID=3900 RepID=A0A2Z6P752_TRISU|nr:hypothetical protein TSUD_281270 [Trifolium subterraneum]
MPFSEAEVKSDVWDCDSYKITGSDGINFGFIKDFWAELRGDIMRFISEFHRNGKLTMGINFTFIALIPKIDSLQRLNDFRPISLVGSLYKILAKVLANRLRLVIGSVISESHTAFVKDRQIPDGILIANEVVDEARKSKKELMLFKVDFEKAYDSVDWGYLDDVMGRMSFPTLWRKWIKECVSTATASVLVNGSPTDEFPIKRGLRQGDPLSPFLFLLAAEGLNVLMEVVVAQNLFKGYNIGERDFVSVSHIQFADDTLLLGVKSWANVRALRVVHVLFETMYDLKTDPWAVTKTRTVAEMFSLGWGSDGEAWQWRRQLRVWEEDLLRECQSLLLTISLQAQFFDRWQWQPDPDKGYTVRGAYQLLTPQVTATMDEAEKLIWHSQVPLKVSIFAWRLLRDRMPTKANLVTRGILFLAVQFCTSRCGEIESAHHLFISCSTVGSLWALRVDLGHVVPLCNSFGLLAFGLFGQKEITDYSEVQQTTLSNCWTDQAFFILMVEDDEYYVSFKLS